MPGLQVLLIAAAVGALYLGGKGVVKGVKVVDHKVCHIATLGHKCKAKPPVPVQPSPNAGIAPTPYQK